MSFLLKSLLKRLPADTTAATATTACAVGGVTLHHWAGIGDGERPLADMIRSATKRRGNEWRACRALVIDEVSMLDGALLDKIEVSRAITKETSIALESTVPAHSLHTHIAHIGRSHSGHRPHRVLCAMGLHLYWGQLLWSLAREVLPVLLMCCKPCCLSSR